MLLAPAAAQPHHARPWASVWTLPRWPPCPSRSTASTRFWRRRWAEKNPASPPPTTTTFRFVSAARTNVAGAKAAVAAAARKFRRFILIHPHLLSLAQEKPLPNF